MKSLNQPLARIARFAILLSVMLLGACGAQYEITDLTYGDIYYADRVDQNALEEYGQVTFTDNRTGATITLNNAEIRRVSRSAVRHGTIVYVRDDD